MEATNRHSQSGTALCESALHALLSASPLSQAPQSWGSMGGQDVAPAHSPPACL